LESKSACCCFCREGVGETVGDTLGYTDGLEVGSAVVGAVVGMKDGAPLKRRVTGGMVVYCG